MFCEENNVKLVSWLLEQNTEFKFDNKKIIFIPDVIITLKINNKDIRMFIEFDTASEDFRRKDDFPTIGDKITKYRYYYLSNLWKTKYEIFPALLFVTEDEKRIPYFNKKCKEKGIRGYGIYYKDYKKFLKRISV